jgi:hypothetical protein
MATRRLQNESVSIRLRVIGVMIGVDGTLSRDPNGGRIISTNMIKITGDLGKL